MRGFELVSVFDAIAGVPGVPESYWALRGEARLAGMPVPSDAAIWDALAAAAIDHVVCLTQDNPSYDPALLVVDGFRLQDLSDGSDPSDPERELSVVMAASRRVETLLTSGRGVAVQCEGGRGRTGTFLGVALVSLGFAPSEVVDWLDLVHRGRDSDGWPESPWQRRVVEGVA